MTNTNTLFIKASRNKVRFPFKGLASASVEDLWSIPLEGLDSIFKTLNSEIKQVQEESLLNTKTEADKELELKIEIVKYIVSVKIAESNARLQEKEIKEHEQKLMSLIEAKKNEGLQSKSLEELQAELDNLRP